MNSIRTSRITTAWVTGVLRLARLVGPLVTDE
jgi:hypothetical protein